MLTYLRVKDFAIIDELQVEFEEGLNVITGETGAGKSIIINALSTLMSARTSSEMIRSNAAQAEVTGHFFTDKDEFILRRVVNASGRSRGFLNNDPVTLARLEEFGEKLINIYGQNEFQDLLDKGSYIGVIDNLLSLNDDRIILSSKVKELREVDSRLEIKRREADGREKESSLLEFQIDEIERENLKKDEELQIREQLKILKDSEKIKNCLLGISEGLYEGDSSVHNMLGTFMASLKPFSHIETIDKLKKRIESISFDVEEILSFVKDIDKNLSLDPAELQRLEERLSRIYMIKEKYGKTYEDIQSYKEAAEKRFVYLRTLSTDMAELERRRDMLEKEIGVLAEGLSKGRHAGARKIEGQIVRELGYLSMEGVQFKVSVTDKVTIDEEGRDDVDLLISTNKGEQLKPLRKIASGGELSRIMLAIKRVISGEKEKTLIFDEVDSGIGGRVAELIGKRLKELAKYHQVICITHLPQIAVYGNHHYLVEKYQKNGKTKTGIKKLSGRERVSEVARMLGGITVTDLTIQKAEEMLKNAEKGIN